MRRPASQNGYNYAHNNPVNRTDPSGLCISEEGGSCLPPDRNPVSLIKFDGVTGENWTASEKFEVNRAAAKIAQRLAETYNHYMLNLPPELSGHLGGAVNLFGCGPDNPALRPFEAFLYFYEGSAWFHKTGKTLQKYDKPVFGQWIGKNNKIEVYTDIYEINDENDTRTSKIPRESNGYRWATHELGHGFEYKVNLVKGGSYVRNLLPDNIANRDGFRGPFPGWQQSTCADPTGCRGEFFADMFIGWNYNEWELKNEFTEDLSDNALLKKGFMDQYMARWIALVINRNKRNAQ